jgi:hypothetical protein
MAYRQSIILIVLSVIASSPATTALATTSAFPPSATNQPISRQPAHKTTTILAEQLEPQPPREPLPRNPFGQPVDPNSLPPNTTPITNPNPNSPPPPPPSPLIPPPGR